MTENSTIRCTTASSLSSPSLLVLDILQDDAIDGSGRAQSNRYKNQTNPLIRYINNDMIQLLQEYGVAKLLNTSYLFKEENRNQYAWRLTKYASKKYYED